MSLETLNAAFKDLRGGVGHFLGYGRGVDFGDAVWQSRQQTNIDQCIKGGMRKLYYCGYDWSFLKPWTSVTLASGAQTVSLPNDFGGLEGPTVVVSASGESGHCPVPVTGDVRHLYAKDPSATGRPQCVAQDPLKGSSQEHGPKVQLMVFPEADQAYTLQFAYYLNPVFLSGSQPYAYGGPMHAETLLQACKATAEIDIDGLHQGPQFNEFMRLLEVSKRVDARLKPSLLGYNGDGRLAFPDRQGRLQETQVTFNGVAY